MESKDQRTFHSERQRALHAGDRRKAKGGRAFKPQRDTREYYGETADDFPVSHIEHEEQDDPILPELTHRSDVGARAAPEVSLVEIIKPGRKRKGQFETRSGWSFMLNERAMCPGRRRRRF